jgi:hypothetical protein
MSDKWDELISLFADEAHNPNGWQSDEDKARAALRSAIAEVEKERDELQKEMNGHIQNCSDAIREKHELSSKLEAALNAANSVIGDFEKISIWAYEKLPTHWRNDCPLSIFDAKVKLAKYRARVEGKG